MPDLAIWQEQKDNDPAGAVVEHWLTRTVKSGINRWIWRSSESIGRKGAQMSTNSFNSMRQMIYSNLQLKDTGELLEIWIQNDREPWTDDAFDVIRELLLERIGKLTSKESQYPYQ